MVESNANDTIAELALLGRELGAVRWAQGPGGNVSVKTPRGELWVKASGKALADVATDAGHAKVSLDIAKRALDADAEADRELFSRVPRPSLETYFHALGGKVVAHTHALGALLYACSKAPFAPSVRRGVVAIPYVRPGRGVALAIRGVLDALGGEGLVVLRSHGIVAYADTAKRAVELTVAFDEEERARAGSLPAFETWCDEYLASVPVPLDGAVTRRLPKRTPLTFAPPRYLIPDAPVCASVVSVTHVDDKMAARAFAALGRACIVSDVAGNRILAARNDDQLRQSTEVAAGHDWLEDALTRLGSANYLPDDEPAQILGMPSEQYRIKLAEGMRS